MEIETVTSYIANSGQPVAATAGMVAEVEPFATWYYLIAWYATFGAPRPRRPASPRWPPPRSVSWGLLPTRLRVWGSTTPARAVVAAAGMEEDRARALVERARLAILRGIGAPNAARLAKVGVGKVEDLAEVEPVRLASRQRSVGAPVEPARVRLWVRAAREANRRSATRPSS